MTLNINVTMDTMLCLTQSMRLVLIVVVIAMNCGALFRLCFRSNTLCLHNMLTTAVILANLLYLLTWLSFVVAKSWWTFMSEQVYCLSQNYVVNAMSMVLLGLLAVRSVERTWSIVCPRWLESKKSSSSATHNMALVFVIWILPQLAYDVISLTGSRRLCENPVFHLFPPMDNRSVHVVGDSLGSMLCEEELTIAIIDVHVWQYLVLVLPFAIVTCLCVVATGMSSLVRPKRPIPISYSPWTTNNQYKDLSNKDEVWCKVQRCRGKMVAVDAVLMLNLLWHLIGRPLMLTRTLLINYHYPTIAPIFLDLGSHIMLTISCIFIPGVWLAEAHLERSNRPPGPSHNCSKSTSISNDHLSSTQTQIQDKILKL